MIARLLGRRAKALMARRGPDFVIGTAGDPYMLRWWWLPRNRFFNVYVHCVLKDDDDRALHDHPWASLSLMVENGLMEVYLDRSGQTRVRWIEAGQWVFRRARFAHRLVVRGAPAVTIFIAGPTVRRWGFHCPKGWVHWKDFVATDNTGVIGRGCGDME